MELQFQAGGSIAERLGTSGCYPAALIPLTDGTFCVTLRLIASTRNGNAFTFGVATEMKKSYGDGFGFEEGSVGLMQDCTEDGSGKARLAWTQGKRTVRELGVRLEENDTVSLRVDGGDVTFWINETLIDTVPAPPNAGVAGCTLHTSGAVKTEPFRFIESHSVATEEGVRVARPAVPLQGSVDSSMSDGGIGKIDILEGLCVFLSDETVTAGDADSIAWRLRFSGNDSFSIGAVSTADAGRAAECLFEDAEYPLAINSSGTFGGSLQRLAMSDSDVVVCLNGASRTLDVYTDGSPTPVKSLPWTAVCAASDGVAEEEILGSSTRDATQMHLAVSGFDGCTIDFKPVGKFLSSSSAVTAAVPSSDVLCGEPFVEFRVDAAAGTALVETGNGPSVFTSKQGVVMGRPEKLAWHCIISGNAAFSVGALPADAFDAESAARNLHENTTAPLTINSTGTSGGNQRTCSMMSPQGIVVMLDGESRTLTVHKAPGPLEALGAPVVTVLVLDEIVVPVHLAMSGYLGTRFQFVKLDPSLLDVQEKTPEAHFPLLVGELVELTRTFTAFSDASSGPLQAPSSGSARAVGKIIRVRVGEQGYTDQYRVQVQDDEWWYDWPLFPSFSLFHSD
jgi:hypothetical protein